MDDARIRQLTDEVLQAVRDRDGVAQPDLAARVAALEQEVADLKAALASRTAGPVAAVAATTVHVHPSLQVISVGAKSERCVLEPEKPCVESHACKTFGH